MWTVRRQTINIIVKRCLCFELETGGIIIGWFGMAFNGFLSVVCAYVIYNMYKKRNTKANNAEAFGENYHIFMHVLIFGLLVGATISSYRCIKATKERNHKPFLFTSVWWFCYAILSLYFFGYAIRYGIDGIGLIGLFGGIVFGYFYAVTNSLYEKFSKNDDVRVFEDF